ncbi:transporter, major facilitator family protein [Toxoplasma gondii TgCatPRC2]|uniref:SLC43A transporter (TC 2.A.1.44) family n=15 Tax=Toxoplasma gondii TaxID=5811 RepID=A0A0F7UQY2_TOXGV|nr:transporter, major facilitator family protein [Toxoplasma gondii ME49]EPR57640.1 transporter, major facilitator family protein [Toxoplasma gondii GT1]ESS29239.1 transporter, major facilitator family protein [Toxoplasma gondii VEG]KAF4646085.1 transporter, major facilitator family protein [Toxoplasma gondii]KFG31862.1 transporter, major facilitator family protein [Toxoplasma gondii GAB2-2007-GAL-DOM2]KFG35740.1 transporter, major facilitator family protein [Toxoplasma gondii p89]KFG47191.1 |eukprot:XP_002370144.1 transporter, major facilitator family protein [Toxoplasma gondii ME49]
MSFSEEQVPHALLVTAHQSFPTMQSVDPPVARPIQRAASVAALEKIAQVPNKTPFGISRWVLLAIFLFYSFLTGPSYWNWTAFADIFFLRGEYVWGCEPNEIDRTKHAHQPKCDDQDVAVQQLFTIIVASDFSFSCLSGFLLDYAGPRLTGLAGTSVLLLAWCLLGAADETRHMLVPGAILWGLSSSAAFFPCLSVANLFPTSRNTVIGFLGASRTLSNATPLVLRSIAMNNHTLASRLFYGYAGLCIGLCVIIAAIFIPMRQWQVLPSLAKAAGLVPTDGGTVEDTAPASSSEADAEHTDRENVEFIGMKRGFSRSLSALRTATLVGGEEREDEQAHVDLLQVAVLRQDTLMTMQRGTTAAAVSRGLDWNAFLREAFSLVFIPLCVYEAFVLLSNSFFSSSARHLLPAAYEANQIIQIFAFLPAPLLGVLADKAGILVTMAVVNGSGLFAFIMAMVPEVPAAVVCQYLACLCIAVNNSFIMSQVYCYVNQSFQEGHAGKLIGIACLVAGLPSLAANAMLSTAVSDGFPNMMSLCIGLLTVNFLLIGGLGVARRRRAQKLLAETEVAFQSDMATG